MSGAFRVGPRSPRPIEHKLDVDLLDPTPRPAAAIPAVAAEVRVEHQPAAGDGDGVEGHGHPRARELREVVGEAEPDGGGEDPGHELERLAARPPLRWGRPLQLGQAVVEQEVREVHEDDEDDHGGVPVDGRSVDGVDAVDGEESERERAGEAGGVAAAAAAVIDPGVRDGKLLSPLSIWVRHLLLENSK